jgi:hypothetical protein
MVRFSHTPNHAVPASYAQRLGFDLDALRREGPLVYTDQTWVESEVGEHWIAAARLAVQDGRVIISEIRVFPRDRPLGAGVRGLWSGEVLGPRAVVPPGGLTSSLLRAVRLPNYRAHAIDVVTGWQAALGVPLSESGLPGARTQLAARRPRAGRPDRFYAELAAEYVRALATSRRPVADIARRRKLTPEKIRDMVHEARERKLLSPGRQGAPDGYLLPAAEQLLGIRRQFRREPRKGRHRVVRKGNRR